MGVVHKAEVISFPKWYNREMEAKHWRSKWLKHLDLLIKWNLRDFVSLKHGIHDSWGQLRPCRRNLCLDMGEFPNVGSIPCWIPRHNDNTVLALEIPINKPLFICHYRRPHPGCGGIDRIPKWFLFPLKPSNTIKRKKIMAQKSVDIPPIIPAIRRFFFKLQRSPWMACDKETASRTPKDKEQWNEKGKMWSITIWWFSSWKLRFWHFWLYQHVNRNILYQRFKPKTSKNKKPTLWVCKISFQIAQFQLLFFWFKDQFCSYQPAFVVFGKVWSPAKLLKKNMQTWELNWIRCMGLQRVLKILSNKLLELRAGTLFRYETTWKGGKQVHLKDDF